MGKMRSILILTVWMWAMLEAQAQLQIAPSGDQTIPTQYWTKGGGSTWIAPAKYQLKFTVSGATNSVISWNGIRGGRHTWNALTGWATNTQGNDPPYMRWRFVADQNGTPLQNGIIHPAPAGTYTFEVEYILDPVSLRQKQAEFLFFIPGVSGTPRTVIQFSTDRRLGPLPPQSTSNRGTVVTLQTRLNKETGRIEVIKNGVYTSRGFIKFDKNGRLNQRQTLRNYR